MKLRLIGMVGIKKLLSNQQKKKKKKIKKNPIQCIIKRNYFKKIVNNQATNKLNKFCKINK